VCGRMTATTPKDTLARVLDVDEVDAPDLPISWNVAPTQPVYLVATSSGGARRLRALRWGLVPSWAKDPRIGGRLINARAETLSRKPAFRSLVDRRRALLPVSGFYEWRRPAPENGNVKQPFYFHRPDSGLLVFAGLWDLWLDAEQRPLRSCTVITTMANKTLAPVHHRMPVVLSQHNWDEWLQPGPLPPGRLAELLVPAPEESLDAYPVGEEVNKAGNDGPELIEPRALHQRAFGSAVQPPLLTVADTS
jgi:putative SOS response-associated peptidase YedK